MNFNDHEHDFTQYLQPSMEAVFAKASYANRSCGPCRLLLSTSQIDEEDDNPYDTSRCIAECVPASARGKWLPTLQVFLKYILAEKLGPEVESKLSHVSTGTAVAIVGICKVRTHSVLGLVAAVRLPDGSISLPRPIGAIDRIKDKDVELYFLIALRLRDIYSYPHSWKDAIPPIQLRRRSYNLCFDPVVSAEIPSLVLPNARMGLLSYFPFEVHKGRRPTPSSAQGIFEERRLHCLASHSTTCLCAHLFEIWSSASCLGALWLARRCERRVAVSTPPRAETGAARRRYRECSGCRSG